MGAFVGKRAAGFPGPRLPRRQDDWDKGTKAAGAPVPAAHSQEESPAEGRQAEQLLLRELEGKEAAREQRATTATSAGRGDTASPMRPCPGDLCAASAHKARVSRAPSAGTRWPRMPQRRSWQPSLWKSSCHLR